MVPELFQRSRLLSGGHHLQPLLLGLLLELPQSLLLCLDLLLQHPQARFVAHGVGDGDALLRRRPELLVQIPVAPFSLPQEGLLLPNPLGRRRVLILEALQDLLLIAKHRLQAELEFFHQSSPRFLTAAFS